MASQYHEPVRDDVNGLMFGYSMVRQCPEPHVRKRYGVGGIANVSVLTCQKCRHKITYKLHGGLGCGYELGIQEGKDGDSR